MAVGKGFSAPWPGPSRQISRVCEDLSKDPENSKVRFYTVNVDGLEEVGDKVGLAAVPTFVLFKGGAQVAGFTDVGESG
ncbi:thioredoxin family protein [Streptomyces sp. NPDC046866]|uniref:thioredoxin family protein n=1 Tax=Streptomyces sp. NPDC046866 TaxID=3154921 RepID=UPI0034563AF9